MLESVNALESLIMETSTLTPTNKDVLHKRVSSFQGLSKSFRFLSYISQLGAQLNSSSSVTTHPNPQACGIFETDYTYQNPPAPAVLSEIHNLIQTVVAEKELLLEELQKLDHLAEEKAECECLEGKINQLQKKITDNEKLCNQMPQLKSSIFKLNKLEHNIDTYQRGEMLILEQEVQNLQVAQEKWLNMTNFNMASLQSILQESQTKELQLRHELWTDEDMGKLSEYKTGKSEVSIASYTKRNDDQEKASNGRLKFMQEALDDASKTASAAGELCKLLSHASSSLNSNIRHENV
ncbi:uncharacterized protein [Procambarus clarkii]|uniref:uncharacterized protein isoform X2 n=2 Tax=Procambarus clarkii TaxID=6728 RepID=UPI0037441477